MSFVLRLVRRLAGVPGFRALTRFGPLLRLSFALRGSLMTTPMRFALHELVPGNRVGIYRLRGGGARIAIRHHTPDVLLLDEIFSQREYELPAAVRSALEPHRPLRIVDLGANIGLFGAFIRGEYPDAELTAVEADPGNADVLQQTVAANAGGPAWNVVRAFAATEAGTVRFVTGQYSGSHVATGDGGILVPTVDAFQILEAADFVKIDVEGAEWPLLADPRFEMLTAAAVVVEYHDRGCTSADPAAEAERALRRAGFATVLGPSKPQFAAGVVWGVHEGA